MSTYNRIYCDTDNKWEYLWQDASIGITQCPTNVAHTVTLDHTNPQSLQEEPDIIKILEEEIPEGATPTGGHYMAETIVLDIPAATVAGEETIITKSYGFPIGLVDVLFDTDDCMEGDRLIAHLAADTIIGALTADIGITENVLNVSETVIDNIQVGYECSLFNGPNMNRLGVINIIDKVNRTITTSLQTVQGFSAATPTYVRMTVPIVNMFLKKHQNYRLGSNTVGSSYIAENVVGEFIYQNWELNSKKLYVTIEFFY